MGALLSGWWAAIWPNLAANILWVPAAAVHHAMIKRHITRLHKQQASPLED